MAIIDPTFIDPDAPPRVRGQFIVQKWRDKYVLRSWPKRGGPKDARLRDWQREQFAIAAQMCANPWCIDYETARMVVRGTQMVPRDFLMMCCYARGYVVIGPDGEEWPVADHGPPPPTPEPEPVAALQKLGVPCMTPYASNYFTAGYMGVTPMFMVAGDTLTGVLFYATSAVSDARVTPGVYDDAPGYAKTLQATGDTVVGVTAGINKIPFSAPFTIPRRPSTAGAPTQPSAATRG
jgi:hypothetical protein